MYLTLFNAVTEAVTRLSEAQQEAERMYMEAESGNVIPLCDFLRKTDDEKQCDG